MGIQHIALQDIEANRYRNIDRYRINEAKIEALIQSYDNSGFWDGSLQARPHPTRKGKYELAFGHHRIEAARRKGLTTVGIVVADRSDADMLRMMADENREEFKGDHLVAIETIGATIEAFGRGEIALPAVDSKTNQAHIHYAAPSGAAYAASTLARFLGWTKRHGDHEPEPTNACRLAFDAYHERANIVPALAKLPEDDRSRQTTATVLRAVRSARVVAQRAKKPPAEVDAAVKRAANETVKRIKNGDIASKVKKESAKIGREAAEVARSPVEISQLVRQRVEALRTRVNNFAVDTDSLLVEIWPYREQLDDATERVLLESFASVENQLFDLFTTWTVRLARTPLNVTPA